MTPSELVSRVTAAIALAALLLALPAAWLAGITGALGVLAGAALAALNFRGLARRTVASLVPGVSAARASAAATLGLGLALAGPAVAVATGVVHPVGLVVGLTLLPCAVVVLGLRAIRGSRDVSVIEHPPLFSLGPTIPDHVTYTWVVMILLTLVAFLASRNIALVPQGAQNAMEVVLEQFQQMIDDVIGPHGRPYLPLIATLGLFILIANLLSLVPGAAGPTANLNTTAACALVVFGAYHWIGVRKQGALTYLAHFAGPVPLVLKPLMFVIEIISHLARPLSLTLRLFGNMFGGHILLAIIFFLMGLDGLIGWALSGDPAGVFIGGIGGLVMIAFTVGFLYPLKILVSFLQAFIFVMLTMLYISGALEHEEHHAEHH